MLSKKGIGPVIASSLLLVIAVVSIVGFQGWYVTFQSESLQNVDEVQNSPNLKVEALFDDRVYLSSSQDLDFDLIRIVNDQGNSCEITELGSKGLISYWDFDDVNATHALDSKGGNHGELINGVSFISGYQGNAARFVKSNSTYISIPADSSLQLLNESGAISGWTYMEDAIGQNEIQGIFRAVYHGNPADGRGVQAALHQISSGPGLYARGSLYNQHETSNNTLVMNGSWIHLVVTWDLENIYYYINNNLDYTIVRDSNSNVEWSTPQPSWIGRGRGPVGSPYADGLIDEVRVYNKTLDSLDVDLVYNIGYLGRLYSGNNLIPITDCNINSEQKYVVSVFTSEGSVIEKVISN